jgi:NtrC-family two-component system sensor histidine kinase KinB
MMLRRKLVLYLVVPALLVAVVGGIGIYALLRLETAAAAILSNNYRSIQQVRVMERALQSMELGWAAGGQGEDPGRLEKMFDDALAACELNVTEAGEGDIVGRIRKTWEENRSRLVPPPDAGAPGEADASERLKLAAALHGDIVKLIDVNERGMFMFDRDQRTVARLMIAVTGGSTGIALLTLFLFGLVAAGRISKPMLEIAESLHRVMKGAPAGKEVGGRPEDEIGRLRHEMDALLGRLALYEDEQKRKVITVEGRFSFLMEGVQEGLILFDDRLKVLAVNGVCRRLLGLAAEPPAGTPLMDLPLGDELKGRIRSSVAEGIRTEISLPDAGFRPGQEERICAPKIFPILSGAGEPESRLLMFIDVTEERRFEESRRRFIAILSHQLKTPLTSLSMSVNLLHEAFAGRPGKEAELVAMARADCESLAALTSELIDTAREVTHDLSVRPRRVDLARLLRYALHSLRKQAEEKGLVFRDDMADRAVTADVDPVKFPWVITNIVGNAIRYTTAGGAIAVGLRRTGRDVEVTVSDTGRGIEEENLGRLFLPYTTVGSEPEPGTHGLGLAIAREVVEAHRGTIAVESQVGKGTTFTVRIPAESGTAARPEQGRSHP